MSQHQVRLHPPLEFTEARHVTHASVVRPKMLDVGMKRVAATVSEIGYLSWTSRGHGHGVAPCRDLLMCHCRAAGTACCDMTTAYFRLAAHGCQGCALVGADSQRLLQRWFGQTVKMSAYASACCSDLLNFT